MLGLGHYGTQITEHLFAHLLGHTAHFRTDSESRTVVELSLVHTKGYSYFFGIGFLLWLFVLNLTVFSLLNSVITFQSLVINVQLHV